MSQVMYERLSKKLELTESVREKGELEEAAEEFVCVVEESSQFLNESEDDSDVDDEEEEMYVSEISRLRAVASYQGALTLHQLARHEEGDKLLSKLGFQLRLCNDLLNYAGIPWSTSRGATASSSSCPAMLDNALPDSLLLPLSSAFGVDAKFWSYHNYPTPTFFSYNLPLKAPSGKADDNIILQAVRHIRLALTDAFPVLSKAKSAEVWAHSRTADGHHQLHYDLDEVALRQGKLRSPLVSCVLFIEVPEGGGAPTLICNKVLQEEDGGDGFVCKPLRNRLLAFRGDLLHCVVPGIPRKLSAVHVLQRRVTLMVGFWEDVSLTQSTPSNELGPNMPFPSRSASFLEDLKPLVPPPKIGKRNWLAARPQHIENIWVRVPQIADSADFGEYHDFDVNFTGRFFLRSTTTKEIDEEVLSGIEIKTEAPPSPNVRKKKKARRS